MTLILNFFFFFFFFPLVTSPPFYLISLLIFRSHPFSSPLPTHHLPLVTSYNLSSQYFLQYFLHFTFHRFIPHLMSFTSSLLFPSCHLSPFLSDFSSHLPFSSSLITSSYSPPSSCHLLHFVLLQLRFFSSPPPLTWYLSSPSCSLPVTFLLSCSHLSTSTLSCPLYILTLCH